MSYTIIDRRASALGGQRKDRSLSSITTIGWHYTAVMRSVRKTIAGHEAYWRDTLGWDRGGYHFYIDADGNIYQNYDYERITWGVKDNNGYVVHISVEAGNGNDYSQAQIDAREWLTLKTTPIYKGTVTILAHCRLLLKLKTTPIYKGTVTS